MICESRVEKAEKRRKHSFDYQSFPLPVCEFGRAYFCKSFRYEEATYGVCPSKKETYYGYKVHVLTTIDGYISRYIVVRANQDDREGLCLVMSVNFFLHASFSCSYLKALLF